MPWGMRETMTRNYATLTCKTNKVLPRPVRDALKRFNIEDRENYTKDDMKVVVSNNYVYCKVYKQNKMTDAS